MGWLLAQSVVPPPTIDGLRLHGVALPIPAAEFIAEETATRSEELLLPSKPPPQEEPPPEPVPLLDEPDVAHGVSVLIGTEAAPLTEESTPPQDSPRPVSFEAAPPPTPPGSDTPSPILHRVDPTYPPAAKRAGEQGLVVLLVKVGTDGVPDTVTVTTSSGHHRLDTAAAQAVQRWRFAPAAAPFTTTIPVQFVLR